MDAIEALCKINSIALAAKRGEIFADLALRLIVEIYEEAEEQGLSTLAEMEEIEEPPARICAWKGCNSEGRFLTFNRVAFSANPDSDRKDHLAYYCSNHSCSIIEADGPEYVEDCPNCSCSFGVN